MTEQIVRSYTKIPKIIHYVWFGNGSKSPLILKCIESWKKYCPDFEIIEWNENSIKNIKNIYLEEALEAKFWAFASDYVRLYALFNHGGIYLDTDTELTAPIDKFLNLSFFCSFETQNYPATAFLGAKPHDELIKLLLRYYEDRHFIHSGKADLRPNPKIFRTIISHNFPLLNSIKDENSTLILDKDKIIFPCHFFCKKIHGLENFAIHHFNGSWLPLKNKTYFKLIYKFSNLEIIKSKSEKDAFFPPKIDSSLQILFSFTYKERRRIYIAWHRNNLSNNRKTRI